MNNQSPIHITNLLVSAAEKWPNNPALTFSDTTRSWKETFQRCHAAATIYKSFGVGSGDRVAFLGFNSNILFENYFAPALIGAIFIPVNYRLSLREMIECVEDCTPTVLIVDPFFLDQARSMQKACESISTLVFAGPGETPEGLARRHTG